MFHQSIADLIANFTGVNVGHLKFFFFGVARPSVRTPASLIPLAGGQLFFRDICVLIPGANGNVPWILSEVDGYFLNDPFNHLFVPCVRFGNIQPAVCCCNPALVGVVSIEFTVFRDHIIVWWGWVVVVEVFVWAHNRGVVFPWVDWGNVEAMNCYHVFL